MGQIGQIGHCGAIIVAEFEQLAGALTPFEHVKEKSRVAGDPEKGPYASDPPAPDFVPLVLQPFPEAVQVGTGLACTDQLTVPESGLKPEGGESTILHEEKATPRPAPGFGNGKEFGLFGGLVPLVLCISNPAN